MTSHKTILLVSHRALAKPLRSFSQSRGYSCFHVDSLEEAKKFLERRKPEGIIIDYKLIHAAHNGSLEILTDLMSHNRAFRAVLVPLTQLAQIQPWFEQNQLHDYLLNPIHKEQLGCLLHKIHNHAQKLHQYDRLSLEDLVKQKLSQVLQRLDLASLQGLHEMIMPRLERPLIKMVLDKTSGNQLRAAAVLGINRNTLRNKMKVLHIDIDALKDDELTSS